MQSTQKAYSLTAITKNTVTYKDRSCYMNKTSSSITMITLGILLILGSIISAFALVYVSVFSPALSLLIIPILVGLVLIARGICSLHTEKSVLRIEMIKPSQQKKEKEVLLNKKIVDSPSLDVVDSAAVSKPRMARKIYNLALIFDPTLSHKA